MDRQNRGFVTREHRTAFLSRPQHALGASNKLASEGSS
jgi:hypothetical protein